jgi:hypothetical protein
MYCSVSLAIHHGIPLSCALYAPKHIPPWKSTPHTQFDSAVTPLKTDCDWNMSEMP